ncbi:ankyrin [Acephala macrosclerotiorum]|nr:ankyrin [Acephala macrosclerotiorum]
MDPIGGAASLVTLIDVAINTFKLIHSLTQRYQHAPAEIQDLRHRLEGLSSHLLLLHQVQKTMSTTETALDLDSTELEFLKQSLNTTSIIFAEILDFLKKKTITNGRTARLRWVFGDASKVKAWETRLQRHGGVLQTTLLLLNNRYSNLFEGEFKAVKDTLKSQTSQLNRLLSKSVARFSWGLSVFNSELVLPYIARLNGSICCSEDSQQILYGFSLRLHALFCLKVFCMEVKLKQASLFSWEVSRIGTGVVLKNVVPDNSTIMVACQSGDTPLVGNLLIEGQASVNDITSDNFSPISHAIAGGSVEVLSLLVSKGADVRKTLGRFQTGTLDWALAHRQFSVARWLLENRADVHHISARGWTPAFSLFGAESRHQAPCEEFLELLSGAGFDDFNARDGEGWTILHRTAAYGTADQVKSLLARKASLTIRTKNLGWTPIFCAVHFNNLSTFMELITHQSNFLMAMDIRNWTLLHVAVNARRLDIMRLLIAYGADPHASTFPRRFFVPKDLRGRSLTPTEIAMARGTLVFQAYCDSLVENGYDLCVKEAEDDTYDLFWPAFEEPMDATSVTTDRMVPDIRHVSNHSPGLQENKVERVRFP